MTTVAASSSFPMPHREASLPPLRYLFGQQAPAPTSRRYERTGEEEDEALPLLVSMYAQRREAEPKQLPTISSMLSGGRCPSPTSSRPMPEARASSSSPVPQPSPSSPSSLSPGLFVLTMSSSSSSSPSSSSFSPTSSSTGSSPSSSPLSFSSPSSPSSSAEGAVANHAYASATNSLMELSDIISSMPALQNLPVPSAPLNDSPSPPASLGGDADGNDNDNDDPDYRATSPVSSRTRRVTRRSRKQQQKQQQQQQLQIERIRSELEQERDRARDLQRELQLALQERAELLQLKGDVPPAAVQAVDNSINAAAGLSFLNVLNEQTEGGSQLAFAHLPRANSLPSFFSGFADADASDLQHVSSSSELGLRSRSAPMLPPIGSVPALSPYLKRKRASLPAGADSGARRSLSPASSPLRPSTRVSFSCGDSARPSRRRRIGGYGEEEDEDYEPTASANSKKIKRSRSISEGGRRLTQASSNAREGRRRSHQQFDDYAGVAAGYDHAEAAAAFIASRRARAVEYQSSRASMDVVEGADQEDDDGSATTTTTTTPTAEFPRRDSVLCFIKDHPHASFWLSRGKARN